MLGSLRHVQEQVLLQLIWTMGLPRCVLGQLEELHPPLLVEYLTEIERPKL